MSLTADAVTRILEQRYDYLAARVVLKTAASKSGLSAEGPFDGKGVEAIAAYIEANGSRVSTLVEALKAAAAGGGKATAKATAKPAAKKDEAPAEEAPAEEAPAEEAAEDAAPAEEKKPTRGRRKKTPAKKDEAPADGEG
ncbi:MAG: hypothetical protein ACE366_25275 [Bradymonadia bacterium]